MGCLCFVSFIFFQLFLHLYTILTEDVKDSRTGVLECLVLRRLLDLFNCFRWLLAILFLPLFVLCLLLGLQPRLLLGLLLEDGRVLVIELDILHSAMVIDDLLLDHHYSGARQHRLEEEVILWRRCLDQFQLRSSRS